MAGGRFSIRSFLLAIVLLTITFALLSIKPRAALSSLSKTGPDYHPPKPHDDPPSPKPEPKPILDDIFAVEGLNEETESDLTMEEDDIGEPGDEARPFYELGRVPNPKAEEQSNGDDWLEAYEPGVAAETYKNLAPEEDGDKIYHKPHAKMAKGGQESLKEKTL